MSSSPSHQLPGAISALDIEKARQILAGRPWHKRAKTSTTVESSSQVVPAEERGGGLLKRFLAVPFDIQLEVFSHLDVRDLLRMCRMKPLRPILMSKSAKSTWRRAREVLPDLPPILEGLSEVQYADLVFDQRCHRCLGFTIYIQWALRARLCRHCLFLASTMTTENALRGESLGDDPAKICDLLTITLRYDIPGDMGRQPLYHCRTLRNLVQESAPLRRGTPEYGTWFSKKKEAHSMFVRSYQHHEKWWTAKTALRPAEHLTYQKLRWHSIIDELRADGWGEELKLQEIYEILKGNHLVYTPRELTPQEWTIIRPPLTAIMSKLRADELERRVRRAVSQRAVVLERLGSSFLATLPETPHKPPASALCVYQPFLDIINNTPPEEDATDALTKALEHVPAVCEKWRQEQEAQLKALLQTLGRSDDLSLAVNAFTCAAHHEFPKFSNIFHHPHFADHQCFFEDAPFSHGIKVRNWSDKAVRALGQVEYEHCGSFVRMAGLDPATAAVEDMDGADVFFLCETCDSRRAKKPVNGLKVFDLMRWRTALNHRHVGKVHRVEDAGLLALGRRREKRLLEKALGYMSEAFVCVHCDLEVYARAEHLRSEHGIEGDVKIVDHFRRSLKYSGLNRLVVVVGRAITQSGDAIKN